MLPLALLSGVAPCGLDFGLPDGQRLALLRRDLHVPQFHGLCVLHGHAGLRLDADVFEQHAADGHLRQADDLARGLRPLDGDVDDAHVAHDGRGGVDGVGLPLFLPRLVEVEEVDGDGDADVLHRDVAVGDVLDHTAAVARRLDADAVVRVLERAVLDRDVARAASQVAAERSAMTMAERAAGDEDVLQSSLLRVRLEGDVVVAHVKVAVAEEHVAATRGVDAVRVRRVGWGSDLHVLDCDLAAAVWDDVKLRRVLQRHALDADSRAARQQNQFRAGAFRGLPFGARLALLRDARGALGAEALPPDEARAVNRTLAANLHIRKVRAADERED